MPQSSAPLVGVNLSDVDWRDSFGDEAGVLGDLDGTAYRVTLPTGDSDVLQVGSPTQRSMARVAGFVHRIPAGETESLSVPAAASSARNDIIALRYDPQYTGAPGPVRLVRIEGTSAGLPLYDDSAPGQENLPLWSVTRRANETLSRATVTRLYTRLAPTLDLPASAPLPLSSPLGTRVYRGNTPYVRELGTGGVPIWSVAESVASGSLSLAAGWTGYAIWQRVGRVVTVQVQVFRANSTLNQAGWTAAVLGDGLPARYGSSSGLAAVNTNVYNDPAYQMNVAGSQLQMIARWGPRSAPVGSWFECSFTYLTA